MRANTAWLNNLNFVLTEGRIFSPRGMPTRELLAHKSVVDMQHPVVTIPGRSMGYKFMAAEAHWILSGDNRVETIAPYANIKQFSDDGYRFQGAYGPRVTEQLRYVVETLVSDPDSRQAVLTIWRENPRHSKDIPCTIALQFFIRDNQIHCSATMRSSDLWLGWVYDVFNFTMITTWVALRYNEVRSQMLSNGVTPPDKIRELGYLHLTAGSQHLYERDWQRCESILRSGLNGWRYDPINLSNFESPVSLMSHLVALRDRDWANVKHLHELQTSVKP
jgi:hypothetical protein